jgi:hypothetical protein
MGDKKMSRIDDNKKLLKIVEDYVNKCPNMRFIQILWALNIVDSTDRFYEESKTTLEKALEKHDLINGGLKNE